MYHNVYFPITSFKGTYLPLFAPYLHSDYTLLYTLNKGYFSTFMIRFSPKTLNISNIG